MRVCNTLLLVICNITSSYQAVVLPVEFASLYKDWFSYYLFLRLRSPYISFTRLKSLPSDP